MEIFENYSLKKLNTLGLDQRACFFCCITNIEQLIEAVNFARRKKIAWIVIGSGSNLVFSKDFDGLVIHNQIKGIEVLEENHIHVSVKVAAGESWHGFVQYSLDQNWYGLENLALIPGTVGAAPVQNIGAYGVELCEVFDSLEAWDVEASSLVTLGKEACHFSYRESIFKANPGRFIIVSVTFCLSRQPVVKTQYQNLADYLAGNLEPTPRDVFDAVVAIRSSRLPDPSVMPNAGSFFKNPVVSLPQYDELLHKLPELVSYPVDDTSRKLAAGWLIDQAGWKGKRDGAVGVHSRQALVLVNYGHATGNELLGLAEKIQVDIHSRYGVHLEIEPRVV